MFLFFYEGLRFLIEHIMCDVCFDTPAVFEEKRAALDDVINRGHFSYGFDCKIIRWDKSDYDLVASLLSTSRDVSVSFLFFCLTEVL